ncbi:MAG TPA: hypothetical protein VFY17_09635, partial [Pilimelia sp.]|nr:hypothetical protein [Pilimelia sp.]
MPTSSRVRPTLVPGVARLWRGPRLLQLGLEPGPAWLLELPHPSVAEVIDLLDGARTTEAVVAAAARSGIPGPYAHDLIAYLLRVRLAIPADELYPPRLPPARRRRLVSEAAALALAEPWRSPAAALQRRSGARIRLVGAGPAAAAVARALAAAGVGRLDVVAPSPAGRAALRAAVAQVAPDVDTTAPAAQPDLVVHVGLTAPADLVALRHARRRQAHLLLTVRGPTIAVGPLVPADGGPCLGCLHRHRRDRDPHGGIDPAGHPAPGDGAAGAVTVAAAGAFTAGQCLALLDGRPPQTLATVVEFDRDGLPRRRPLPHHPGCGCRPAPWGRPA